MSKKYIIGIDGGSQSTKVVMYDLEGNVVCEGKGLLQPMHTPDANTAEHPDDDLWTSLCAAGQDLMRKFTGNVGDIVGIGLGSIRCCRALLKADGTPAAPLISWQDARVTRPYEHTNPDVAYVTSFSGYLSHRLTGELKDNIGNYFGQWPVDFKTWTWTEDDKVLSQFGIPRDMLFDVQMPGTVLGYITKEACRLTGFPEGLPVVCSTSDKAVEALGAGLLDDDTVVISLGTYIALMTSGKTLPKDPTWYWPIMSSIPETLLYEGYGIRKGMWTVSWLRDMLGESLIQDAQSQGLSPEDLLNHKAADVPPGCEGLMTILDWLTNPWEPYKRGIMIGFNSSMNYAWMYRSILESIALTLKNNYDNMCSEMHHQAKHLIITGGGSNSDLFMQIFADVFNLPARRNVINGCASLGAAINTAVGLGLYPSYKEAVEKMVRMKDLFAPVEAHAKRYETMNSGIFRDLTKQTDPILKKSYEVFQGDLNKIDAIQSWSNA
ncbi:sugar kinase [Enterobacter sp. RHBSTW-00994]|uniref:FGGY-family carbohydrate kinase n=1 Tax=Enterobacter sp. RHBSTW-00994 TaxID=2742676 RepID=UPI0015EA37F0|nr:FGGY-family carbohydrate kinase [Enterobacter sp. RHBSTW-00994]QLR44406.1 sugar kinase [Enterobacter sp. RHBSTW-00994]